MSAPMPSGAQAHASRARQLRLAFLMFVSAGHKTHYLNWRKVIETMPGEVAPTWLPIDYTVDSPLLRRLPWPSRYRRWELESWLRIRRTLRAGPYDAVLMNPAQMAVKHLGQMRKQPFFLFLDATRRQVESLAPWFPKGDTEEGVLGGLRKRRQREMVAAAAGLLPGSQWAARSLVEDYGADPKRVHVQPFGIDPSVWSPDPALRANDGVTRLLFIGGDFLRKGGDLLLRWAKETSRERWELHVVTGRDHEPLPGVQYHRASNNSDALISLVRRCDLLVLPTRADCNPFVVLEALATGLPVLSTRVGGIPETIAEGETGFLIARDDYGALHERLDAILERPERLAGMSAAARQSVLDRFDARKIVPRTLEIIRAGA